MKIVSKLDSKWKSRPKYQLQGLSDKALILLGGPSFLVAGYWTLMLKEVLPEYLKVVSRLGYIDAIGTTLGLFLLAFGLQVWFFGCIAARCHSMLYDRWFK